MGTGSYEAETAPVASHSQRYEYGKCIFVNGYNRLTLLTLTAVSSVRKHFFCMSSVGQ